MVESIRSLERKLNKKIDNELKKEVSQIDDKLIMGCCDALLMMDDVNHQKSVTTPHNQFIMNPKGKILSAILSSQRPKPSGRWRNR